MNRYQNIPIDFGTDKNGKDKPMYQTVRYPKVTLSENDIYVYTVQGDRFDSLAQQYYKDQSLWWIISIANTAIAGTSLPSDLHQDSLIIPEGSQIRIPTNYLEVINSYQNLNS